MLCKLHLFMIFVLAPFLGLGIAYTQLQPFSVPGIATLALEGEALRQKNQGISMQLLNMGESVREMGAATEASYDLINMISRDAHAELQAYEQQRIRLQDLVDTSAAYRHAAVDMIELVLANMLGDPVGQTFGENATVKVYSLAEVGYRGFMAKVRLHNPGAVRMVLAEDRVRSQGETTSSAARRTGAILAVNAGGFAPQAGSLIPLGITVIDGEVVTFSTHNSRLSFIGFNRSGQLVGGEIETREQLHALDVLHGASFLPTLLKDGERQPIPAAWASTRQPRTLIGHFINGDLLFVVIDGRREGWSMGVTLEEAQEKLIEFKVRDAYNLDGGGSSTFYYDGEVLNRPSDGRERRVTTNIVVMP